MTQLLLPLPYDDNPENYYTWSDIPRPTERQALWNILRAIPRKIIDLSAMQCEVHALHCEAKVTGQNPARYIAGQLKVSIRTAYRRLHEIDVLFGNNEDLVAVYGEASYQIPRATRAKIINLRDSMVVECAAAGTPDCLGRCSARYCICSSCKAAYGYPDNMSNRTERWLLPAIRMTRNEAYNDAKHQIQGQLIASLTPTRQQLELAI